MKFMCPKCKKILVRDVRSRAQKSFLTKGGKYRSLCDKAGETVLCIPLKNAAAVALGSIKTKKKTASSKVNGRKGGRPNKHQAAHQWIVRIKGKPNFCQNCKTTKARHFDWANKDHKYKRVLKDWIRLCRKCHFAHDRDFNGKKSVGDRIGQRKNGIVSKASTYKNNMKGA